MLKIWVTTRSGEETAIEAKPGRSVMETMRDQGVDEMRALCGGCCACATCHVFVDEAFVDRLPVLGEDENALLESSSYRNARSRLSCQLQFEEQFDGLRVTLAPED
ncbi:2Fe-2S iron-sulfur cluster-binding protein [Pseudomonas sp. Z18(2022)]|uniref:2Fe-2S iron-sulfur cluster-binding protein n=1 Tax=Pseudomonas sp. Z18(2022) TaxID=2983410 RepID=UPI003FA7D9E0